MLRVLLFTLLSIFGTTAFAGLIDEADRWLDRKSEGWFWYQSDPEADEEREEPLEKPAEVHTDQTEAKTEPLPYQKNGPAPLSSAWIRENIQAYLDAASDNPTPENVAAFLYIQRLAMDKSFAFMDASQRATIGNPLLDEINRRPTATFTYNSIQDQTSTRTNDTLNKVSQSAGIFYFVDTSRLSEIQTDIVQMFQKLYPFHIVYVSNDEMTLPNVVVRRNAGHSDQLGITSFPAIALVSGDGTFDIISQGTVSLPDLKDRILVGALRLGVIDQSEYNETRVIRISENTVEDPSTEYDKISAVPIPQSEIIKRIGGGH